MLARIRKSQESEGGFTLIELLVVMIIIGILAAIAIPVFLNQRKKAQDTAAKADVSTLGKEIATYYVDNGDNGTLAITIDTNGRYHLDATAVAASAGPPAVSAASAVAQDLGKASTNVVVDTTKTDLSTSDAWCVGVTNPKGDKAATGYHYSAVDGLQDGLCA